MKPFSGSIFIIFSIVLVKTQSEALEFITNYTRNLTLQVKIQDGLIQGRVKASADSGRPFYAYEGIPYAKPPVGDLRFKPPQPPDKWAEGAVLHANGDVPICIQIPSRGKDWYESEDCLYINVYTPELPSRDDVPLIPVMVWIYGGGFLFGLATSSYYGPDYLLAENVIVVHFNYRVNVFGFLSTGDLESPGNYGLKDQVAALKWVKKNVESFGGDPNKVTIFGESAGGASVQYHLLSPQSAGLFQRAISQSGSVLCPWAFNPEPLKIAKQLALVTGLVPPLQSADIVQHFRTLGAQELKKIATIVAIKNSVNIAKSLPFSPSLEPEHEGAFLTARNYDLLIGGNITKVPHILGFNSLEAAIAQPVLEVAGPFLDVLNKIPENLVPPAMQIPSLSQKHEVGLKIKKFYFSDDTNEKSRLLQYLDFISDSYFFRPITESALIYAGYAPVYMYRFSYEGYFLGRKAFDLNEGQNINGVMHSEEVWYIFAKDDLARANSTDKLVRSRMVRMWTNFAKFGDPTPPPSDPLLLADTKWPEFEPPDNFILNIDASLSILGAYKSDVLDFWKDLYRHYGIAPFNTY